MTERHVADAESRHLVLNINPDFCRVGKSIVAFDISRQLSNEKSDYAKSVSARSESVLLVDSVVRGVVGDAGNGVASNVSQNSGHVVITQGSSTVSIEGRKVARDGDRCEMNVQI